MMSNDLNGHVIDLLDVDRFEEIYSHLLCSQMNSGVTGGAGGAWGEESPWHCPPGMFFASDREKCGKGKGKKIAKENEENGKKKEGWKWGKMEKMKKGRRKIRN